MHSAAPPGRSTGGPVRLDVSEADELLARVQADLGRAPRRAAELMGSEIVHSLRTEPTAPAGTMRRDTGHMSRSYIWRAAGRGGTRVGVENTARNERGRPYAPSVEARFGVVRRLVRRDAARIAEEVRLDVLAGIRGAISTRAEGRTSRARDPRL